MSPSTAKTLFHCSTSSLGREMFIKLEKVVIHWKAYDEFEG